MSLLIRGVVFVAGLAGAFIGGHYVNRSPARSLPSLAAAERPTVVVPTPAKEAAAVPERRENLKLANFPEAKEADRAATEFLPPVGPPTDPKDIQVDREDPPLKWIEQGLGIKTSSVIERPVPEVLVGTKSELIEIPPPPQFTNVGKDNTRIIQSAEPPKADDVPEQLLPARLAPFENLNTPAIPKPTKLLRDRAVLFDFHVIKSGPSKIAAVEVWARKDAGKWEILDRRPGEESPFRTHLAGDGVYGLKLVIESESGMRTPAPTESSVPELVAELDTTPPQVELLAPESAGGVVGKVLIRWGMADRNLDPAATRLAYSIDGTTWQPIVCSKDSLIPRVDSRSTGLQKYSQEWTLPPNVPHQVHIRVTARDKAGNEASDELPKKLSVDLVIPEGRLTGISSPRGRIEKAPAPRIVQAAGDTAGGI